jgi:hypothetical protein
LLDFLKGENPKTVTPTKRHQEEEKKGDNGRETEVGPRPKNRHCKVEDQA